MKRKTLHFAGTPRHSTGDTVSTVRWIFPAVGISDAANLL